ncbi:MAG: helix-turn-helix transcriptional regulator [Anaerolineales bacterium]|nr:helix-turn-helix transcriptional regulator [Anaerolineales bacterium]
MRFSGRLFQDGEYWLAEIPILDVMTQGFSQEDAVEMVADLVESMANIEGFQVDVFLSPNGAFEVGSTDPKPLISLLLQRKRELSGLTLAQAAERLGASSRNAYARYEQGRTVPSIAKLNELLRAISPDTDFVLSDSVVV